MSLPEGCRDVAIDSAWDPRRYDQYGAELEIHVTAVIAASLVPINLRVFVLPRQRYREYVADPNRRVITQADCTPPPAPAPAPAPARPRAPRPARGRVAAAGGLTRAGGQPPPPSPPSRTNWTRLVPPPVLTEHVSLTRAGGQA